MQDNSVIYSSEEEEPVDDNRAKAIIISTDRNLIIIPLIYIKFTLIENKEKQIDLYKDHITSLKSHPQAKILKGGLMNVAKHKIEYVFNE